MNIADMIRMFRDIVAAHPEADKAEVWAENYTGDMKFHIKTIGYDKRHHPPRIKLED
jgi:hypothetical protein